MQIYEITEYMKQYKHTNFLHNIITSCVVNEVTKYHLSNIS